MRRHRQITALIAATLTLVGPVWPQSTEEGTRALVSVYAVDDINFEDPIAVVEADADGSYTLTREDLQPYFSEKGITLTDANAQSEMQNLGQLAVRAVITTTPGRTLSVGTKKRPTAGVGAIAIQSIADPSQMAQELQRATLWRAMAEMKSMQFRLQRKDYEARERNILDAVQGARAGQSASDQAMQDIISGLEYTQRQLTGAEGLMRRYAETSGLLLPPRDQGAPDEFDLPEDIDFGAEVALACAEDARTCGPLVRDLGEASLAASGAVVDAALSARQELENLERELNDTVSETLASIDAELSRVLEDGVEESASINAAALSGLAVNEEAEPEQLVAQMGRVAGQLRRDLAGNAVMEATSRAAGASPDVDPNRIARASLNGLANIKDAVAQSPKRDAVVGLAAQLRSEIAAQVEGEEDMIARGEALTAGSALMGLIVAYDVPVEPEALLADLTLTQSAAEEELVRRRSVLENLPREDRLEIRVTEVELPNPVDAIGLESGVIKESLEGLLASEGGLLNAASPN